MCLGVVARLLPQMLKSTFFEKFSHSTTSLFEAAPLEKISQNVDFTLLGKQCIVSPNYTFFHALAYCAWHKPGSIPLQLK